ncbi:hypothetical protein [Komagataeibacter oboediens]|nr:hypothetical protein [Komagataeibacter oboediens]
MRGFYPGQPETRATLTGCFPVALFSKSVTFLKKATPQKLLLFINSLL